MIARKGKKFSHFAQKLSGILLGTFLVALPGSIGAASLDSLRDEKAQVESELQAHHEEAHATQATINSLEAAVAFLDQSVARLQAEIRATDGQIAETTEAIAVKEQELAAKKAEQDEAIRVVYELEAGDTMMESLLANETISEATNRVEYLDALQQRITEIMNELLRLKAELEEKKSGLENLRAQQVDQRNRLAAQQAQKVRLLKNSVAELNKINRQISADHVKINNIEASIAAQVAALYRARSSGNVVSGTGKYVGVGDTIGQLGSTGYSTGPHVHFECIRSGTAVNPRGCLPPLAWPLINFSVSQEFGKPNWDAAYDWHSGIDLVASYGTTVLAACAGEIILDQWYGGYGNAVVIDCGNGLWTLYGHMIN